MQKSHRGPQCISTLCVVGSINENISKVEKIVKTSYKKLINTSICHIILD